MLAAEAELLRFEGLTLDLAGRTLTAADGHEIRLTRAEFALLSVLIGARGRALSRDQLLDAVTGRRGEPFDRSVDVLIGRVRRKIEAEPKTPRLIVTIPGHGYKFAAKAARAEEPVTRELRTVQGSATLTKPTVERRQVTVMVCSLSAATGPGLRLDAEERHHILRAFRTCCGDSCSRFGGRLGAVGGETVHVYFGYPVAHEHDVEQAVRAGLAVVEAVARLDAGSVFPFGVRVGIATGVALAGAWPGEISAEASALAQELTGRTACGTVLVSATTRRLAGGLFECRVLDGSSPAAYQVLGETPAETRFDALHAEGLTPLVGRKEEIALLGRRWHRAEAGDGNVVLLSGEPGIGKSRLVRELRNQLADRAHNPLICCCAPHQQESSYHPFIRHLEHTAGFAKGDNAATRLAKLGRLLAERTGEPEVLALFADLLSIPNDGSFVASDLSPRERRDRTTAALLGQVVAAAASAPVLLVFEDVHWMDETSLEILDALVDSGHQSSRPADYHLPPGIHRSLEQLPADHNSSAEPARSQGGGTNSHSGKRQDNA
jgi:DNA-binding winged helix-turn-helix (wHTH) protein